MTKGSRNRNGLLRKVHSIHIQIAGRRLNRLQKIPHDLGKNHALVALENLKVQEMTRSAPGDEGQAREACTAEVIAEQGHPWAPAHDGAAEIPDLLAGEDVKIFFFSGLLSKNLCRSRKLTSNHPFAISRNHER